MSVATIQSQLAAIQTAFADIAAKGVSSYSINGRNATSLDISALWKIQEGLLRMLSRATAAAQGRDSRWSRGRLCGFGQS
jgi:hypothetical protein